MMTDSGAQQVRTLRHKMSSTTREPAQSPVFLTFVLGLIMGALAHSVTMHTTARSPKKVSEDPLFHAFE